MGTLPRLEGALLAVGRDGRKNQLFYSLLKAQVAPSKNVIFFGGDRVDESDVEVVSRLQKPESVLEVLKQKFPTSSLWMVLPSRYEGPWACYDNFLTKTTRSGEPLGYKGREPIACCHLYALLDHAAVQLTETLSGGGAPGGAVSEAGGGPRKQGEEEEEDEEEDEWDAFIQSPFFGWSGPVEGSAQRGGLRGPLLSRLEREKVREEEREHSADVEAATFAATNSVTGVPPEAGASEIREEMGGRASADLEVEVAEAGDPAGSRLLPGGSLSGPSTVLMGFSKGGVVINQILTEVASLEEWQQPSVSGNAGSGEAQPELSKPTAFAKSIREVHYIDVGLNSRGAYITDASVLRSLVKIVSSLQMTGLSIIFHGTPRQWADRNRVWIGQEKDRCITLLQEAASKADPGGDGSLSNIRVLEKKYYWGKKGSLAMHFEVIEDMVVEM